MSMKTEFKMEDKELLEMIDIARAPSIPVMLIGDVSTGNEKQESANDFWKRLGEKYKFKWNTVEAAPNKGYNFFLAEPIIEKPKPPTIKEIVEQLELCDYVTRDQLHDLKDNKFFIALKEMP